MNLDSWRARALIEFGYGLFRLWARTLRLQMEDPHNSVALVRDRPVIFAIWHNRLLMLPPPFDRWFPTRQSIGLISASRDGDLVSILIERSGYGTIRGSTSRKGVIALRQLVDALAAGSNVLFTPDGPRGPVYEVSPGVIFVAQKSGAPIVPIAHGVLELLASQELGPLLCPTSIQHSRASSSGPPIHVEQTTDAEQFEAERLRFQDAMMSLVEQK